MRARRRVGALLPVPIFCLFQFALDATCTMDRPAVCAVQGGNRRGRGGCREVGRGSRNLEISHHFFASRRRHALVPLGKGLEKIQVTCHTHPPARRKRSALVSARVHCSRAASTTTTTGRPTDRPVRLLCCATRRPTAGFGDRLCLVLVFCLGRLALQSIAARPPGDEAPDALCASASSALHSPAMSDIDQ